jgi:hypothetical protein
VHGHDAHSEHGGQLALGRQRTAGREQAQGDLAPQLFSYVLVRERLTSGLLGNRRLLAQGMSFRTAI